MNFSFLPSKIKEQIKQVVADEIPVSLARSNTSIDGETGESYVLAFKDKMVVFSRKLGKSDYTCISGDFGNIGSVDVRKEGINTFLDTEMNGKKFSLKFSSFEEKSLTPMVEQWQKISDGGGGGSEEVISGAKGTQIISKEAPASTAGQDGKFSLKEGLAVALMFIAGIDDEIAPEEDLYILNTFNKDRQLLQKALKYYKANSFDEFLIAVSGMSQEQKLCFVANMMELGMCDGVLHRSEIKLIRQFCDYMEVSEDEYDTIKQVLLIKNKISVL